LADDCALTRVMEITAIGADGSRSLVAVVSAFRLRPIDQSCGAGYLDSWSGSSGLSGGVGRPQPRGDLVPTRDNAAHQPSRRSARYLSAFGRNVEDVNLTHHIWRSPERCRARVVNRSSFKEAGDQRACAPFESRHRVTCLGKYDEMTR
jgi:hypothetical protein